MGCGRIIKQTENVQAGRQIRFTNVQEIVAMETILKAYIYEAIEVEKAGLEVNFKKNTEFISLRLTVHHDVHPTSMTGYQEGQFNGSPFLLAEIVTNDSQSNNVV
ncbi:hypothetical protein [Paenibacillus sp. BJ-4]|uniref:hypothetical protein n=1 Tax=Paenibacillus sp. BJ-4 TaxID=2878097 RepID=UPI001CF0253F|nr:hypothetical protein [Paenibacillus sp. BJ-4]